jgi:hypothetical protein
MRRKDVGRLKRAFVGFQGEKKVALQTKIEKNRKKTQWILM